MKAKIEQVRIERGVTAEVAQLEPECKTCDDARFIRLEPLDRSGGARYRIDDPSPATLARNVEPCPTCAQKWTPEQLAQHRISPRRLEWTFEAFRALEGKEEARKEARAWAARVIADPYTAGHLLLWGEVPGTGKTHLAIAAVLMATKYGRRAVMWSMQEIIRELQARFDDGAAGHDYEEQLWRVPVLVIDDLGAELKSRSGWSAEVVEALIEERTAASRPTLITTNLNPSALAKHVDARAASRLKLFRWVEVAGRDMRGEVGA